MSIDKETLRAWALEAGADRCGFASVEPVSPEAQAVYDQWIAAGRHGTMQYCEAYGPVRANPAELLPGARTIMACAFAYAQPRLSPLIASYALGQDYHYVIKQRLGALGERIAQATGAQWRVVVDTAPMRERYWAVRAGLGFIGLNNQLIIPGLGSYFFLAELLLTLPLEPDQPNTGRCQNCGACIKACPGHALDGHGGCDARRCISYLTIEHRGPLPENASFAGSIYGCDVCQRVCPHNAAPLMAHLPEFEPNPELLSLSPEALRAMTPSHYKHLVAHSAMRRVPFTQLLRNLELLSC